MEILGIGPSELLFIVVIALIVLGPKDMQKAGRNIGKWLRQIVTSDGWKLFQQTSREIQTLPNRLMREAALDELKDMGNQLQPQRFGEVRTPPSIEAGTILPDRTGQPETTADPNPTPPPPVAAPPQLSQDDQDPDA
jgi:sec-independent protein translocase protein TatB